MIEQNGIVMADDYFLNKAVCAKCIHHRHNSTGRGDIWYEHLCTEPKAIKTRIDYVTGTVTKDIPCCRDINRDGNCQYYRC